MSFFFFEGCVVFTDSGCCSGAGKVITTLSTSKIEKARELLGEGTPDQLIDYTKENVHAAVGKGTVDFMFDTVSSAFPSLPLMKRGGMIVSISSLPSGTQLRTSFPHAAWWLIWTANFIDFFLSRWFKFKGVEYTFHFIKPDSVDLDRLTKFVDEGKLKPIIGRRAKLSDIEGVRAGCQEVLDGKGGIGKFVIDME